MTSADLTKETAIKSTPSEIPKSISSQSCIYQNHGCIKCSLMKGFDKANFSFIPSDQLDYSVNVHIAIHIQLEFNTNKSSSYPLP